MSKKDFSSFLERFRQRYNLSEDTTQEQVGDLLAEAVRVSMARDLGLPDTATYQDIKKAKEKFRESLRNIEKN